MLDGSWCAYAAGMENAGFVSGLLHGSFSVGAAVGPFFAGALMEKGMEWWVWYYGMVSPASFSSPFRMPNRERSFTEQSTYCSILDFNIS